MKKTMIYHIQTIEDPAIERGAQILSSGGTVVFPTETVYGLGANALSAKAVDGIFAAKGRPSDNPLIVHVSKLQEVNLLVEAMPAAAERLATAFWPGALTLIFKKKAVVPPRVTAGLDTVAVRWPEHPIAQKLIALSGVPVAAPSANISGRPSPTRGIHVIEDLDGRVDCILWSDDSPVGVESTVVDVTVWPPMVLRPGGIAVESLQAVIPEIEIDPALIHKETHLKPKSPGMKYTHYAPKAKMILFEGEGPVVAQSILKRAENKALEGVNLIVLCTAENAEVYQKASIAYLVLGSAAKPEEIAQNLFSSLRECDAKGVELILAEGIKEQGIGYAVMNRFRKAAGYCIEKL